MNPPIPPIVNARQPRNMRVRRTALLITVLLITATCAGGHALNNSAVSRATVQRELNAELAAQVTSTSALFRADGYLPAHTVESGVLGDGGNAEFSFLPERNTQYAAVGMCDSNCSDLDLVVRSASGHDLDSDFLVDALPVVSFLSSESTSVSILVIMEDCTGTCDWAVQLYAQNAVVATEEQIPPQTSASGVGVRREHSGTLSPGDDQLSAGEYADTYTFDGEPGGEAVVEMTSSDLDTYLVVSGPDGQLWENDDYEGSPERSLLRLAPLERGEYTILATSFQPGETGAYHVSYNISQRPTSDDGTVVLEGSLGPGDDQLPSGTYIDRYDFSWRAGEHVSIDLNGDFDTYLGLGGPDEFLRTNDDFDGDDRRSRVDVDLPATGTYSVVVSSYSEGEIGSYTVTIRAASPNTTGDTRVLVPGRTASGELGPGDAEHREGRYRDVWWLELQDGQRLMVDMKSGDVDPYLMLAAPDGVIVQENDDCGDTFDSCLDAVASLSGRYRIVATSYDPKERGTYTLSASISVADDPLEVRTRRPEFHGVFVGISDYPPGVNDLRWTNEDAVRVYEAFVSSGVMREEDGTVLTDRGATRQAVTQAVRDVAVRADPGDSFVFFFSGHGMRVAGDDRNDPDGWDETIELYDGPILDHELHALISEVDADRPPGVGVSLVVLDSCYSGGFSKDLSGPGRMGLFTSEEDTVALVAEKFQAGGYLSEFIADGVGQWLADDDNDDDITAYELSDYIYDRYSDDMRSGVKAVSTASAALGIMDIIPSQQRFVADRSGLRDPRTTIMTRRQEGSNR